MAITKESFSRYIKAFQFRELFNDMGWNNDRTKQPVIVDDDTYTLFGIACKSGFRIFTCAPAAGLKRPLAATRKKIEGKVTKLFQEHLIIFIDEQKREQVWQLAVRKVGSPTKISETHYNLAQDPELLYQRAAGLFFQMDEEEKITIIDVTKRVAENFQQNNERVTKKFYESFKKEHTAFLKFIQGIDDQLNMDWYASLMLNRLMFCYFIQKKGFLDNNKNYLQDKLKACREKKGKNKFYSFYRDFLLALFHEGLGAPEHDKKMEVEIGRIPYLNGGLFDEHQIEKTFRKIEIDDKAFEQLFNFFDEWEWHLDTREAASGKDVNPDVIGYIFEKYINDRAQMGAYYTKEDITDYISKNCIIPWLFDEVKRHQPNAFADGGWLWQMVKASGDEYIYDAVKYGVPESGSLFDDLPAEIRRGFNPELEKKVVDSDGPWLWELRKDWNKQAPMDIALPTEIYREVIERRKRYADIKKKIANGEIKEINDFITCNLNIRQFVQDVLETTDDAEFIRHFYQALLRLTILDPTCGSGAFLFAALNILELLYEACIQRMRSFVDEAGKGKHKFFEDTLAQVRAPEHPNLQYFIYKSIILNNLYGVDIMNEAVEIAKLRLFLKLVATVDADYRKKNLGLEPLPDVDFNIRAGNTLIGYATEAQLNEAFAGAKSSMLDFDNDRGKIEEKCDIVARAFARYKEIQLQGHADFADFKTAKDDLNGRLDKLRNELNQLLRKQHYANIKYDKWLATHQPFHWFAEFYEIIHGKGGFDVVIGNPPYVSISSVARRYTAIGYTTKECGDLFALVTERVVVSLAPNGECGLIIRLSSASNPSMVSLRRLLLSSGRHIWLSSYSASAQPACLFEGVRDRLSIYLLRSHCASETVWTTEFLKWFSEEREHLFKSHISYSKTENCDLEFLPKIGFPVESSIYEKVRSQKTIAGFIRSRSQYVLYYHESPVHWHKAWPRVPYFYTEGEGEKRSVSIRELRFDDKGWLDAMICIANSSLFYWFYNTVSDCRHLTFGTYSRLSFNLDRLKTSSLKGFSSLARKLMNGYEANKQRYVRVSQQTGRSEFDAYYPALSKPILDEIDHLLAQHYGFTHTELDFIINYDIKYRMGKELDNGEETE